MRRTLTTLKLEQRPRRRNRNITRSHISATSVFVPSLFHKPHQHKSPEPCSYLCFARAPNRCLPFDRRQQGSHCVFYILALAQPTPRYTDRSWTVATCKLPPIFLVVRQSEICRSPHTTLPTCRPHPHTHSDLWKTLKRVKVTKRSLHRCELIQSGTFDALHHLHR